MGHILRNILMLALLASCYVAPLHARFTQTTCWTGENTECIEQNTRGSWCYVPTSGLTMATTCTGSSADFASVLEVHLTQGLSVAYYSGIDNTLLGGGDYPIPSNPGVIRLCVSGRSGDGNPQTLCVNALADNAFGNHPYCQVIRGQENVTDGCYAPVVAAHSPSSVVSVPASGSSFTSSSGPISTSAYTSCARSLFHGSSLLSVATFAMILPFTYERLAFLILSLVASFRIPSNHARSTPTTSFGDQCIHSIET
jgi:hypothetical protein